MASDVSSVPSPSPDHRRVAAGQFERANQVVSAGNYDYGINLLLSCCKLDPANLVYRQALRRTMKLKYKNNLRGSWLAWLTTGPGKAKVHRALRGGNYLGVLELGEHVLKRNPWDVRTQMAMAEAADALGLLDLAVWNLEQARQKAPEDAYLNRALARLYEKRGNFAQAIALWDLVRKADPHDTEARGKGKELSAQETIARGQYDSATSGRMTRPAAAEAEEPRSAAAPHGRTEKAAAEHSPAPPAEDETLAERRVAREAAALKARLDADPTNANGYLQLAAVYRRAGQLEQARSLLQKGAGPTGNNFELAVELLDLEIEPFRQNLTITEQRLQDSPDDELRRIRIRLLKEINARELEMFRMKAHRYPTDMQHRLELGVRLLRAGSVDEAIRELQGARSDPRTQWKCLLYLGHCFKSRNNWKLARRNFDESLNNLPSGEDASKKELYFQLAQGCAEAGELQDAVNYGTELANLDFGYRDISTLLDEWQERLSQH